MFSLDHKVIGSHALHVVAALAAVTWAHFNQADPAKADLRRAVQMFWVFVVGVWPPLYAVVYLW